MGRKEVLMSESKRRIGPRISETLLAGRFVRDREVLKWVLEKIRTKEGLRDLRALVNVEETLGKKGRQH